MFEACSKPYLLLRILAAFFAWRDNAE